MLQSAKAGISLLAITLLSMVGCAEPEPANPNFPQSKRGPVGLEADLVGEPVSEIGCLRVMGTDGTDFLLI